jgi:hypothetical protein
MDAYSLVFYCPGPDAICLPIATGYIKREAVSELKNQYLLVLKNINYLIYIYFILPIPGFPPI